MVELDQVIPLVDQILHQSEDRLVPALTHDVDQLQVALILDQTENPTDRVEIDLTTRQRDDLIQQRQSVTHAAIGLPSDDAKSLLRGVGAFSLQDAGETGHNVEHPDAPEVEPLTPGENRGSSLLDLLRLRRRENEDHSRRWLFQDLQEGVPRLPREHVRLVDDIDLRSALARRCIHRPFAQISSVVHASVRSCVDLDDVECRMTGPDASTRLALTAGFTLLRPVRAVEGHGKHTSQRGLAHPPGSTEQVGVSNPVGRDGAPERLGDVLLGGDIGKRPRPVLTR